MLLKGTPSSLCLRCYVHLGHQIKTSGGGLHEMGKGSVRAVIASEGYLSDDEFRLHDMHVHDHVLITKKDEHVEEISMKQ